MQSWLIQNIVAIILAVVSFVSIYAVDNYRLSNIENRQDRQGTAITDLQTDQANNLADYAALSAKIDALTDDVVYIRSRIDAAVK